MSFILWRLPYAAGLGIIHAAACRDGVEMEFAGGERGGWEESDLEGMREVFQGMKENGGNREQGSGIRAWELENLEE